MKYKKVKISALLTSFVILLSACGNLNNMSENQSEKSEKKNKQYVKTSQLSNQYYRTLLEDGKYLTSETRGATVKNLTSNGNTKYFETGLLTISQKEFSTEDYFYQEGQKLTEKDTTAWLERKSGENNQGLNPEDNKQLEPDKRNPIYIQQILEDDFVQQTGDKKELKGITIGIAMNKIDYYTKEQYGAEFQTHISRDKLKEYGQKAADEIVKRLRKKDGVGNIPIVVALFEQAPKDSLTGGVYFEYGVSKNDKDDVQKWTSVKERNAVFPLVDDDKDDALFKNDAQKFESFRYKVQSFFPNISGVTADVHYENDQLAAMTLNINTQFYGKSEIISFTQHILDSTKELPEDVPIDINIQSVEGMQAFLNRASGDKKFYFHIF